ncbi:MAG TPA: hypothetical protein VFG20_14105, partial [Planctomycetaceae bacterium]|nr:hypothetical protein [Planctomycetaceae bacterium]
WVSRARSAAVLDATLKAWDTLEPPVKTERRGVSRAEFFARRVRKGAQEQTLFYARRDDVLILSDQEALVSACALRLNDAADSAPTVPKSFLTEADLVVPDASTAAVWVYGNPRAWDRWLDREFDNSPGAQLARNVWRSLRGLGVSLRLDAGPTLTITATIDPRHEHPGWIAATTTEASDALARPERLSVLRAAPEDAVLVAGGSLRPEWWLQKLQMLQSDREKEDWRRIQRVLRGAFGGLDPFGQVAPALFRDWGVVVAPRGGAVPTLRPADWSVASVHQLSAKAETDAQFVGAIDDALGLGMQLLAANINGTTEDAAVTPVRTRGDGTLGRMMSGRPEWEFGYEFAANRLLVGWPLAVMQQRFATSTERETELSRLSAREFTAPSLMAWVNLEAVRAAMGNDPERKHLKDRSPLAMRLAELVDRGFAAISVAPERVEFKVGGRFASTR